MIQANSNWIDVSAEISNCERCFVALSYFSAETPPAQLR